MESRSPDITFLRNTCAQLLGKLTLAQQNNSRIDNFTGTVSSDISNFPTPNNSPEELSTEKRETITECMCSSDIVEQIQDLLTELDGCNSNKSSVILPSTTRKRLQFDDPEKDTTSPSDLKKLCSSPINELPQDDYILPHSLKYIDKHLTYLVNNIYKSIPKHSSKTSPNSFSRASKHILAFKRLVIDHGRYLADNNHWLIVMDYVFMAWKHVSSTPKWDNPTHNTARRQCFKSLLELCMISLKKMKGKLNSQEQEHYIKKLKLIKNYKRGVKKCLQLLDFDFTTQ
ncbi:uncharacterized protein LOC107882430 [Acyrthosiphon pisum]|uniref:Uncharacterized protein n=1 Tax=Acyrthosiphon pisum TaxID=7029 RepID=A0A8R2H2D8_ACYPI|nr:uncharacterized protein LOC107882430 [Acyrthosiphon pisum]XP_016656242.1 uncharacterized protein LOC107882430 [Acyrthosiphon pisum]|eukprot:XP_016656239.1 PREDICTED: uncharacterized protein LOC107882430 [Acyrthosiphon pisum]